MNFSKVVGLFAMVICCSGVLAAQFPPLTIVDEALPALDANVEFHVLLRASGGAPPYVWSVVDGELPEGVTLSPEGLLAGRPSKPGPFTVTLKVEDSAHPAHNFSKEFTGVVTSSLLLEWLDSPKVHDNRIDGVAMVSNGSKESFDLTVVIVAVPDNGRATAIGYEHFVLKAGESNVKIPFGNTLPHGAYVIHADAIAEIASRNTILRQRLQTPEALKVVPGP
ncbi:MAG: putative Ig domain-containing protein [Terriglobales bacterium]|jgi:hypothetical protein